MANENIKLTIDVDVKKSNEDVKKLNKNLDETGKSTKKTNKSTGDLGSNLLKMGGIIAGAAGSMKLFQTILSSTQRSGDALAAAIAGVKGGLDNVIQTIAGGNWWDVVDAFTKGYAAAHNYAIALDEIADVERSITIEGAKTLTEIARLQLEMEKYKADPKKQQEIANQIIALEDKLLADQIDINAQKKEAFVQNLKDGKDYRDEDVELMEKYISDYGDLTSKQLEKAREFEAAKIAFEAAEYAYTGEAQDESINQSYMDRKKAFEDLTASLTEDELAWAEFYVNNESDLTDELRDFYKDLEIEKANLETQSLKRQKTTITKQVAAEERQKNERIKNHKTLAEGLVENIKVLEAEREEMVLKGESIEDITFKINQLRKAQEKMNDAIRIAETGGIGVAVVEDVAEVEDDLDFTDDIPDEGESPLEKRSVEEAEYIQWLNETSSEGKLEILRNEQAMIDELLAEGRISEEVAAERSKEIAMEVSQTKIAKAQMALGAMKGMLNAWSNFQNAKMKEELKNAGDDEKKKDAIRKEYGEKKKTAAIIGAIIDAASAVLGTLASVPGPAGWVMAAVTSAMAAVQIATISKQKYAQGGVLQGPSHAQGGILTPFGELEGGEGVINASSMSVPSIRNIASAANVAGGGKDFSTGDGGVKLSPESISQIVNGYNNKRVFVSETDISETQDRVAVMEESASL